MTITVVKGVSAKAQAEASLRNGTQSSNAASAATASTAASANSVHSNDAAVSNVRAKAQAGTEKLREYKQAKGLASDVADTIRADGESRAHGGLDALSARDYFG